MIPRSFCNRRFITVSTTARYLSVSLRQMNPTDTHPSCPSRSSLIEELRRKFMKKLSIFNPLKPNDPYSGRTAPLTSKRCILYIYSTNTGTEYFKHCIYSPFFPLQNAVCFIILIYLVPVYSHFIYRVC